MTMQEKLRGVADKIEMLFPDDARVCRDAAEELDVEAAAVMAVRDGKSHRRGIATEKKAASLRNPGWNTQKARILHFLFDQQGAGLTHDEVEVRGPAREIHTTAHRTRMSELVDQKLVMDSGRTRPSRTNTDSEVWILTPKGLRYVEDQLGRRR